MPTGVLADQDEPHGAEARHFLRLAPVPASTSAARRFVREHAPPLPEETGESLVLLTSELVTNAVLHARTTIEVGLVVGHLSLAVGVHDEDLLTDLQDPYADREGGWGLGLVEALADAWASTPHPEGGKTVWFRLLRGDAPVVPDGAAARDDHLRRSA